MGLSKDNVDLDNGYDLTLLLFIVSHCYIRIKPEVNKISVSNYNLK